MEALGTKPLLHVENLSGLDPEALGAIARRHPTSLYQHDFSTFCVRPHLFEQPHERFCEFSRDSARCVRCLREEWDVERDPLPTQREATRELLTSVRSVIFPSEYLRNETSRLFDLSGESPPTHVVAPGLPETDSFPPPPERRPTDPYRVAFLGGGRAHKGAEIFADLVARLADAPGLEWHVFGGYGLDRLRRLRRSTRVCIHGFYAPGSLAALLRRHRIDLALHLSIVPESYSLTLSECGRAGVSVLAFDKGVYSSRVEIAGLVPFSGQMATDVAGLEARLRTRGPGCRIDSPPSSSQAARAMTVLLAAEVP
jgi:glycosyltransferase involved in cell wall biosynthesis